MDVEFPRVLKRREVCAIVGFAKTKLWEMIRDGRFPAPLALDGGSGWDSREVRDWQEKRLTEAKARRDSKRSQGV